MEQTTVAAMQQVAEGTSTLDIAMRIILALVTIVGGLGGTGMAKVIWTLRANLDSTQKELTELKKTTRDNTKALFSQVGAIAKDNADHREQLLKEKNEALAAKVAELEAEAKEKKK